MSIHTLKACENLKMDILDFESPCDNYVKLLFRLRKSLLYRQLKSAKTNQKKPSHLNIYITVAVT